MTSTKRLLSKGIVKFGPCRDAVKWLDEQKTAAQAWHDCKRGDWMLWLLGNLSGERGSEKRKKLVLCACECARLALKHVAKCETRPLKAIETAEAWARNEGKSLEDVRKAAYAAADAAAYAAYAAYAAADVAAAADAAADAAYAAYAAADAAAYAAYAAADAAYADAKAKTLAECADIVRKHYPTAPKLTKP